ncbi:chloride channel protein [Anaeromyxobacter oryzae]|uniref:Chloride channel protein n=1 Tax=Anaeromyxobacter oryzae TaxID=2918170 RepID=A0ABN6MMQ7_9BACT|nr:chloride channel protein [Anaeromyxobacter oryzae]
MALLGEEAPIDLRIVGRTLLQAGAVGVVAGAMGAAFFASLELVQRTLLGGVAGFEPVRAHGETFVPPLAPEAFRPWLLALLPAIGGLASGLLTWRFAPEASGGGGNAAIEAYHHGGVMRRRVIPVKGLAAVIALSSGGSGGREGPTMQIGAAVGAAVGRLLPTSRAERRVLLVAGIAAGISAVFRTPLGAALLATEMLYRDDFESEALVPAVFASVVSYSIVIALFGETTLFGQLPRFGFRPGHLPLYGAVAIAVSLAAVAFVRLLRAVQGVARRIPGPVWLRPALGGLAMGVLGTALALWMARAHGDAARGFGVFGGGYGVLQAAITGADWLPAGASVVGLLLLVAVLKMIASALTIGSGAAAGDFAPSLVIGGLVGSAFGHAARLSLGDPTIDPGAFALVGMGTLYGGLAHAPLSALVLVAELAGSYDLLVPMMLAIGIAYVALRRYSLYPAQVASRSATQRPGRAPALVSEPLGAPAPSGSAVPAELPPFRENATLAELVDAARTAGRQRVVAIAGAGGLRGLVELEVVLQVPATELAWLKVSDAMVPFAAVPADATWGEVALVLERSGISQVPVVRGGEILGWIGDRELRQAILPRPPPS